MHILEGTCSEVPLQVSASLSTEKNPSHLRAVDEGSCVSLYREAPAFEDITAAGHGKREPDVLLDEQDRDALCLQRLEHRLHLLHDARREPEERLVDHKQPRQRHKAAAPSKHLPPAAPKGTRELALAL